MHLVNFICIICHCLIFINLFIYLYQSFHTPISHTFHMYHMSSYQACYYCHSQLQKNKTQNIENKTKHKILFNFTPLGLDPFLKNHKVS